MPTSELLTIQQIVDYLPVFAGYDVERIAGVSRSILALFNEEDGLDTFFAYVRVNLPDRLRETAYALAVEVVSADVQAREEELNFLLMLEDRLELPKLPVAAIEYSARVRHRTL